MTIGAEEKKMGIKGSSHLRHHPRGRARCRWRTCWARSARATTSPSTSSTWAASSWAPAPSGGAKLALTAAVPYTKERHQFGQPLCDFGLIRRKIADVTAATFLAESMVYRTAGLLDAAIATLDKNDPGYDREPASSRSRSSASSAR